MNSKEYFKHLSIVILGILIAVWINNLATQRNERKTQKLIFNTILNELSENHERVLNTIQNLDSLLSTLAVLEDEFKFNNSDKDIDKDITINYKGLMLTNVGYETAKYTGILKGVNHNLTSQIVINYETQNSLVALERQMTNEIFELVRLTNDYNIRFLMMHIENFKDNLNTFKQRQQTLIIQIQESL